MCRADALSDMCCAVRVTRDAADGGPVSGPRPPPPCPPTAVARAAPPQTVRGLFLSRFRPANPQHQSYLIFFFLSCSCLFIPKKIKTTTQLRYSAESSLPLKRMVTGLRIPRPLIFPPNICPQFATSSSSTPISQSSSASLFSDQMRLRREAATRGIIRRRVAIASAFTRASTRAIDTSTRLAPIQSDSALGEDYFRAGRSRCALLHLPPILPIVLFHTPPSHPDYRRTSHGTCRNLYQHIERRGPRSTCSPVGNRRSRPACRH
ncbi:uncharacterized protein K452DRAFT_42018 [Aplosporella prunicola CBS 121167]|uniref:Uncharacterized protein n=1 Tax=Aplosporella prunicola CBS 121167 TaxID=1176127 RepID=A0A6A6B9B3_9PEZI|nr:uncharacterized protein K452DRAFT_42018 [Aplosporella prunicola CBS 121167]KAF2140862.1 hypothetical protein K452DRAFT_42018 [Aplosporella prunicola CBS 121167]